ncbi:MAG: HAD family hydrolase [Jhaorihella sp.]
MLQRLVLSLAASAAFCAVALADPLPSWNDGDSKARIRAFVDDVTDPASDSYVPPEARIAVFDNDGTLWAEQPAYFQLIFAFDDVARRGKDDPSVLTSDALRAAAAGDYQTALAGGNSALAEILALSHSGLSVEQFQANARAWLDSARHPKTGLRYEQMTYQPMTELLRYLRDEGFITYIVSGGGVHFIRVFAERAYGIPPQQVIGTSLASSYHVKSGQPVIMRDPQLFFNDDKEGKPLAIDRIIGRRPIFAAGNSDGDFQMLEYTTAGDGARLGLLIHHTDATREFAYDREGHIGVLARGLDEGPGRGWLIVDMAKDWSRIYSGAR